MSIDVLTEMIAMCEASGRRLDQADLESPGLLPCRGQRYASFTLVWEVITVDAMRQRVVFATADEPDLTLCFSDFYRLVDKGSLRRHLS